MVAPTALANMRHWIIDKIEDNKKKLHSWQIGITFAGIFVSAVVALLLFSLSKPLALSALILFGLSLLVPLLVPSVPFSKDGLIVSAATTRYKRVLADALYTRISGIDSLSFPESVLDEEVKIRIRAGEKHSTVYMREIDGEIDFYMNDEKIMPNSQVLWSA